MANNIIIDDPPYYALPCGRFVEDYLWAKRVPFWLGSALKYRFRAGKKNGETREKDIAKESHYVSYAVANDAYERGYIFWNNVVGSVYDEMLAWDGKNDGITPFEMEY